MKTNEDLIRFMAFWDVVACNVCPEYGGGRFLKNNGNTTRLHCTRSQKVVTFIGTFVRTSHIQAMGCVFQSCILAFSVKVWGNIMADLSHDGDNCTEIWTMNVFNVDVMLTALYESEDYQLFLILLLQPSSRSSRASEQLNGLPRCLPRVAMHMHSKHIVQLLV
jgi:hypothetical protein